MKEYELLLKRLIEEADGDVSKLIEIPFNAPKSDFANAHRLKELNLIELEEYIDGGMDARVLASGLDYFENKRKENRRQFLFTLREWIAVGIALASLVVAIIALIQSGNNVQING